MRQRQHMPAGDDVERDFGMIRHQLAPLRFDRQDAVVFPVKHRHRHLQVAIACAHPLDIGHRRHVIPAGVEERSRPKPQQSAAPGAVIARHRIGAEDEVEHHVHVAHPQGGRKRPGQRLAHHVGFDAQTGKGGRGRIAPARQRCKQGKTARFLRKIARQAHRDGPPERVSDDQRTVQPQLVDRFGHIGRLRARVRGRVVGTVGIAHAGAVYGDAAMRR